MSEDSVAGLTARADACAERLRAADRVLVVSHIDADGLTSAAIATAALFRAGIEVETAFAKQLDDREVRRVAATAHDVVLFTDFGSGQLEAIAAHERHGDFTAVVADHHRPVDVELEYHLNPMLFGVDGAAELSGAGTAFLLAEAIDGDNDDLAGLAVIGAVGDMQASSGGLVGVNERIAAAGVDAGVLETGLDLALYGKQTRPLPKLLEYASEVSIPGISNDEAGAVRFLEELDLELQEGGEWRAWVDLDAGERRDIVSALVRRGVERGVPASSINGLVGTTYELATESPGTELRDASEFSTLLNATARYERPDVGLAVCLGNRDGALVRARRLLANHRRNLSTGLDVVRKVGVTREGHLQWFHARDRIRPTIVGIVAGMAIGTDGVRADRPIIAFAEDEEATIKVSGRATQSLVRRGLDLSVVMEEAARSVGGEGGGHDIAAGATIPAGEEAAFIEAADRLVGGQVG